MGRVHKSVSDHYNCLLVVSPTGRMRQLFTPFAIRCKQNGLLIPPGAWVYVDAIVLHPQHLLCFWINQRWYPYHYFQI